MINQRAFAESTHELERAQRDYSKAKNTIEQTKQQLAEFVLLNAELVSKGEVDLSAYQEIIKDAEFSLSFARESFDSYKKQMLAQVNRITLCE